MAQTALEHGVERGLTLDSAKADVGDAVFDFLYDETGMRPRVLVHLEEL
jgi:hypothetical protein